MSSSNFRAVIVAFLLVALASCDSSAPTPQPAADGAAVTSASPMQSTPADPLQPRYSSSLAEGINFRRPGYPEFVAEVAGISGAEDWGRWSDAALAPTARIRFNEALPENFTLHLTVRDFFGLNAGKSVTVTAGNKSLTFILSNEGDQDVQLAFSGVNGDSVEIAAPNSSEPTIKDGRRMGIGLVALSIQH